MNINKTKCMNIGKQDTAPKIQMIDCEVLKEVFEIKYSQTWL